MAVSGVKTRGRRAGGPGDTERKRKMGKTEIKCRETEGAARRKKDDQLDDTTVVPVVHWVSLFPFPFFLFSHSLFSTAPFSILAAVSTYYTCRILLDHAISLRFLSALKSFLYTLGQDRIFMLSIRRIGKL